MYPFHIPELLLCEKVLYKEKKQIFTYQISPFTSFSKTPGARVYNLLSTVGINP